MPRPKARITAAEQLHVLEDTIRKQSAKIGVLMSLTHNFPALTCGSATLQRDAARAAAASKPKNLIPRPKGQVGRSTGYNLQEEMGLNDDQERYLRLSALQKTVSKQDKTRLAKTISLIAQAAPFFAKFEGFWPVHDIISTYLLNLQTRRRKDLKLERLAEGGTPESADESEDGMQDGDKDYDIDSNKFSTKTVHIPDSEDDTDEIEVPKSKKKAKLSSKKRQNTDELTEGHPAKKVDAERSSEKSFLTALQVKARHQVDLTQHSFFDSPLAKPKPAPKDKPRPTVLRPLVWSDLPPDCPTVLCDEALPENPDPALLSLFNKRQDLVHKAGATGAGVAWIDLQICDAIGKANKRESFLKDGEEHAWPTTIDYAALHGRILALDTQILRMIEDPIVLDNSPIWEFFLQNIGCNIFAFSKSKSKLLFADALDGRRCGYYGPKGELLINSTIIRMLALKEDDLGDKLYETLVTIVKENPDVFDKYDEDSALISIKDFVSFILTPFAVTLLISEDKGLSYEDATSERNASNMFGEHMQPEADDPVIEDLHRANIRAMSGLENPFFSQPPRHRKSHLASKPKSKPKPKQKKEITLSLDDFPEPNLKSGKPPPKDRKSGGKKMASDVKYKALPTAPPTGRSTRSKTKIQVAAAELEPESD
ncbi:hypothetical protein DFH09DRAFT_1412818 [Mycena vulgaris]|nr:hypothetical protein DFH09DRAFT_1412818 [Mycena vulgaris]